MQTIAVLGTGYVGLVSGACLADFGHSVVCVDTDAAKINRLQQGEIPIFEPGLDAVVSRNMAAGRLTFTTNAQKAIAENEVIFISVGTPPAEDGSAVYDFMHPDRIVIGAETEKAKHIMKDVYRTLYLNETPFVETNLESAEMIKYASNAFLAVKITLGHTSNCRHRAKV